MEIQESQNYHLKNKKAEQLLIEKLKSIGFTDIKSDKDGRRKCIIINQNHRKIKIYFFSFIEKFISKIRKTYPIVLSGLPKFLGSYC